LFRWYTGATIEEAHAGVRASRAERVAIAAADRYT
jgi:hypothetical protein